VRILARLLASGLGLGWFPVAPATFATLVLYALLWWLGGGAWRPPTLLLLGLVALLTPLGAWASRIAEESWGEDAGRIVVDEIAGGLLALAGSPMDLRHLLVAFVSFRAMDVLKPPPAYQIQSLPRGWGVMADDLVAGAYALAVVQGFGLLGWL
jgi:phosphatidylglycerophosphatase A